MKHKYKVGDRVVRNSGVWKNLLGTITNINTHTFDLIWDHVPGERVYGPEDVFEYIEPFDVFCELLLK